MNGLGNLQQTVMDKVYSLAETKVRNLAGIIQGYLQYEFANDLTFSGNGKDRTTLSNVQVEVIKVSQKGYKLNMSMAGLSDHQKELFEFYFNNAKKKALSV